MHNKRITASPNTVQLLLTRECNLNCYYCSAHQFSEKERESELTTSEWISLLEKLKDIQVFTVDFSGGELFLKEDIFEILETAKKCGFPKVTITTNGTLVTDTIARKVKHLNFKTVAVSIDGDEESHDRLRGAGTFGRTLEGITHLVNNGVIPKILFTPLKSNYRKLGDVVDMFYPLGVRELSFNILHPTGRCAKIYKRIMLDCFTDSGELNTIVDSIREKYRDFKIAAPPLVYHCFPTRYHEKGYPGNGGNGGDKKKLKPCSAAHSSCNITSSGWVIPCSELYDFKGGNVREQDILDIWKNSTAFEKIRNLSDIPTEEIPYCRNCDYNVLCNAGCRADAYAIYGDLSAPDPFCPYWREK